MNFLSQSLANLTSGGKLYIFFQMIYLTGALFFTYVQFQILQQLKNKPVPVKVSSCDSKYYSVVYKMGGETSKLSVFAKSSQEAANHVRSIYKDVTIIWVE